MTVPWWGKDVAPERARRAADAASGVLAPLTEADPSALARELHRRRPGFTPTWTSQRSDDPGNALIAVYAEQHALVASAVGELPIKARIEHLRAAGVMRRAPRPLATTLQFEVTASATRGVLIGEGFEVLGRDDGGALVPFETTRPLFAVPATIAVLGRRSAGRVTGLTIPLAGSGSKLHPFGFLPSPGIALYIGLEAEVPPSPQLAIGFTLAGSGDAPPPASAGGLFTSAGSEPPRLSWELFDGKAFGPAEVIRDETRSFNQSGVVELRVPSTIRHGAPPGTPSDQQLYWLRCQLLEGEWHEPPALTAIGLNVVPARSGRTIRDEVVETPITADRAARRVLQLASPPVLEGTLDVRIDEGGAQPQVWRPVDDLSALGTDARAFLLDAASGTLTFSDEASDQGRSLPDGFRHVRATYRTANEASFVAQGAISTLVGSAPFLASVTNLEPATGGAATETLDAALRRGPREIRARGRAVTTADYEELARVAPGADVQRAYAVGGHHPRFAGRPLPGVVGVFVVGAARADGSPPQPTEATLRAVSDHLSAFAARGAEVVAVAPVFCPVRIEATLEISARHDATAVTHRVARALDRWLDPVVGGARGEGWSFGGAIEHAALVRFVLRELQGVVLSIPTLRVVLGAVRFAHCEDVPIPAHALLWPAPHELIPLAQRRTP
jgi:predicted phage baseplate assembly protein